MFEQLLVLDLRAAQSTFRAYGFQMGLYHSNTVSRFFKLLGPRLLSSLTQNEESYQLKNTTPTYNGRSSRNHDRFLLA